MTDETLSDATLDERVAELMERPYRRVIRGERVDGFLAEAPELPGCVTAGETPEEALANLQEAMSVWLETAFAQDAEIPEPGTIPEETYSGRMLLRMPQSLHAQLARRAGRDGVSINQMAVTLLAQALGLPRRGERNAVLDDRRQARSRSTGARRAPRDSRSAPLTRARRSSPIP